MTPTILCPGGQGPLVILCDHASNWVPPELDSLGLQPSDLARHIAWDIGAAGVAAELSTLFDSPAVLSPVSRLVIDCNRHLDAADLIPEHSDVTIVRGNLQLDERARALRIERWFEPYHAAVESVLAEREIRGLDSIVISVHSMTDRLDGSSRPWQIAFSGDGDRSLIQPVMNFLRRAPGVEVGDNQPYSMDSAIDYCIPFHALRRKLPYLQVEFRQDEIADTAGQRRWAQRFALSLVEILLDPR